MNRSRATLLAITLTLLTPAVLAGPTLGTWTPVPFTEHPSCPEEIRDVTFASATTGVAVGSCFTILVTRDAGATWNRDATLGDVGDLYGAHFVDATHGILVGRNAVYQPTVLHTTDGGYTWDWANFYFKDAGGVSNEGSVQEARMLSATHVVGAGAVWDGDGAVVTSDDGGVTWTTDRWLDDRLFGLDFADDNLHGIAVGQRGIILTTQDGGDTWTEPERPTPFHLRDVDVVSPTEAWAVGDAGTVLHTTDGGATWTRVAAGTVIDLNAVDFADARHGRLAGDAGTVLHTADGGATWVPDATGTGVNLEAIHFPAPNLGFAAGHETLLRYVGAEAPDLPVTG